ncbi:phosphopantothenoylcysteine decarboxylase [Alternaria alternata]|nr:phosphopantothenoylcysteine decarboxylase [Alternaria alternata]
MADKEFTYSDVSEHNTKKDLYIVVHDKVYNASSFVDEHPYVAASHTAQCTSAFAPPLFAKKPRSRLYHANDTSASANMSTEVVRKFCSMSEARTQQRHSRMSVTQMKPARSSTVCSSET